MHFPRFSTAYIQASWFFNDLQQQYFRPAASFSQSMLSSEFDWDSLKPQKHLEYRDCFGDFQCALLEVPMDWTNTSIEADHGKTVDLAVIRVPAAVDVTDERYGGVVILNPGGPGGSGIGQVLRGGKNVQTVLSAGPNTSKAHAKYFDILGFDPRGVNNTRPPLNCFPNQLERSAWELQLLSYGHIDSNSQSFDLQWTARRALAKGCSQLGADIGIGKHMATASVVRDIIEIFERHGEWREKEASRLVMTKRLKSADRAACHERTRWRRGAEMVQYWGFSYGTILGATLASMYPARIKRAVLDGVADASDYMAAGWTTNLRDTDKIWTKLSEYCYASGSVKRCPLYDSKGPVAISARIDATLAKFRRESIGVPGNGTHGPSIVTFADYQQMILDIVYNALRDFPVTAQILAELEQGIGTSLAAYKESSRPDLTTPITSDCLKDGPFGRVCQDKNGHNEAGMGIACSDGLDKTGVSKEEFKRYSYRSLSESNLIGARWSSIMMPCTAWDTRPHWRYNGAFKDAVGPNKTANAILFVGNTHDPVTPLYNAFKEAPGFDGAGILHQNSEGHCTYASVSLCSGRALRHYFQTGELPTHDTGGLERNQRQGWKGPYAYCEPDLLPFSSSLDSDSPGLHKAVETDQALFDALLGLNRFWP